MPDTFEGLCSSATKGWDCSVGKREGVSNLQGVGMEGRRRCNFRPHHNIGSTHSIGMPTLSPASRDDQGQKGIVVSMPVDSCGVNSGGGPQL